ncbi:hypothetical protein PVK06_007797 [Gossypium arboreum]|uniref:Uncharacterized protein n=1 Tax=Gossypium arboreum TaxID=29729 RepID=A0ABR0QIA5_GOSAR|nr:hypothetical protein PVK06_007797 [Gossypium arboreum]
MEDIFCSVPPISQNPITPDDGEYDFTDLFSTPIGTSKAGSSTYELPHEGVQGR